MASTANVARYDYQYEDMVMTMPAFPISSLDKIKEIEFDDRDIIIAAYPKCGITWMQEIVYLIHTEGDFDGSDKTPIYARYKFLEAHLDETPDIDKCLAKSPPRLLKTHLPARFFQPTIARKNTKFVVVLRNPKDMLASYYNFHKSYPVSFDFVDGPWEEFFERFKINKIHGGSYFDMQLSWWQYRSDPRFLMVKYEDMVDDPEKMIKQVATHLGKDLSADLLQKIVERTSFKFMKSHPMLNYSTFPGKKPDGGPFMRVGGKGDWRNYFSEEQERYVDNLVKTKFEPEGLLFD